MLYLVFAVMNLPLTQLMRIKQLVRYRLCKRFEAYDVRLVEFRTSPLLSGNQPFEQPHSA